MFLVPLVQEFLDCQGGGQSLNQTVCAGEANQNGIPKPGIAAGLHTQPPPQRCHALQIRLIVEGFFPKCLLVTKPFAKTVGAVQNGDQEDVSALGIQHLPLWLGESRGDPERALTWHFPYYHPEVKFAQALPRIGIDDFALSQTRPQSAIRVGDWALLHFYENDRDELYRLTADLSQQKDQSAAEPARARALRQRLDAVLREQGARFAVPTHPTDKTSP